MNKQALGWVALWASLPLHGQTRAPGPLISAGYEAPSPLRVAPGQVITLFVYTPGTQPEAAAVAQTLPLPTSIGGFSVALEQTFTPGVIPVPLLNVFPIDNCYGLVPSACSDLTAIMVRIPVDLIVNIPRGGRPENFAVLRVSRDGVPGEAIPLSAVTDSIHVRGTCDSSPTPSPEASGCQAEVRHADGTLVTSVRPAAPGETVTLWAYGLGPVPGDEVTAAPVAGPLAFPDVQLSFLAGANRAGARPARTGEGQAVAPLFAGLVPTERAQELGAYQVRFQIPAIPASTPACIGGSITSNLTVNVARAASFASAGICVAPPEPPVE